MIGINFMNVSEIRKFESKINTNLGFFTNAKILTLLSYFPELCPEKKKYKYIRIYIHMYGDANNIS